MQELSSKEMLSIDGGIELTATLLATLVRGAALSFEIGQTVGTAIRRLISGKICSI